MFGIKNQATALKHFAHIAAIVKGEGTEEEKKQKTIEYMESQGLEVPQELREMKV